MMNLAIMSVPLKPSAAMFCARRTPASAILWMGGVAFTLFPLVFASGSAWPSQLRMVFGETRKTFAVFCTLQVRKLLISRMRKRWAGVK